MSNILETLQKMSESPHDYDIGYWWNAVDNAIEEIERLRQSAETKEALLQEKRTEIERLRGLLREALDPYLRATINWQAGWTDRVRKALGEK